jgi:hypothetical protein
MRTFLTKKNRGLLERRLKKYLLEVLEDSECLGTLADCRRDAERVKCYDGRPLTADRVTDWLRGLPLSTVFTTYDICTMLMGFAGVKCDSGSDVTDLLGTLYREQMYDLDEFYWATLGQIIYRG